MNHQIIPSHWWNPLQWFAIFFSLWVKQAWYWQNVRPLFSHRKFAWSLLFQASLSILFIQATMLSCAFAALFLIGSAATNWPLFWIAQILTVLFICFGFTLILGHHIVLPLIVLLLPPLSFGWLLRDLFIPLEIINPWLALFIFCGLFGFAVGILLGVLEGNLVWLNFWIALIITVAYTGTLIQLENHGFLIGLGQNFMIVGVMYISVYLGTRWSIRVPKDEEKRKQLANPITKTD